MQGCAGRRRLCSTSRWAAWLAATAVWVLVVGSAPTLVQAACLAGASAFSGAFGSQQAKFNQTTLGDGAGRAFANLGLHSVGGQQRRLFAVGGLDIDVTVVSYPPTPSAGATYATLFVIPWTISGGPASNGFGEEVQLLSRPGVDTLVLAIGFSGGGLSNAGFVVVSTTISTLTAVAVATFRASNLTGYSGQDDGLGRRVITLGGSCGFTGVRAPAAPAPGDCNLLVSAPYGNRGGLRVLTEAGWSEFQ